MRALSRSHRFGILIAVVLAISAPLFAQDNPHRRGPRKASPAIATDQGPSLLDAWYLKQDATASSLQPVPLLTGGTPIVGRASMVINSSNTVAYTKNFIGTSCDADMGAPNKWQPSTSYAAGDNVISTNLAVRSVATNPGTSGATEPAWSSGFGATTSDGTITWKTEGIVWTANLNYSTGMVVRPISGGTNWGFHFQAQNSGTAGATEPVWPSTVGATVVDGGVTWKAIGFYPGTFKGCDPMQLVLHPSSGPDTTIAMEGDAVGASQLSGWSEFVAANSSGQVAFRAAIAGLLTDNDENGSGIFTAGPGAGTLTKISTSGDIVGGRPVCGHSAMVGINDNGQVIFDAYATKVPVWKPSTFYPTASRVIPTVYSGLSFSALSPGGTSGSTEPVWPTTPGRTVTDGSITWVGSAVSCDENNNGLVRFTPGPGQELLVAQGSSVGGSTVVGFGNDNNSGAFCGGCVYDDIDGLINLSGHVAVVLRLADGTQGVYNFTGPGSSTQVARTGTPNPCVSLAPRISINNSDQVAFKGVCGGVSRISRFTPPGTTTTVVSVGDDVGTRSGGAANGVTFTSFGDFFDLNNGGNLVFQAKLSGTQEGYYFWNGTTGLITEILRKPDTNSLAPEMIALNDANRIGYVTGSARGEFSTSDASEGHETGGLFFWNAGVTTKAIAVGDVVGGNTVTAVYAQHRSFVRRQFNQNSCIATAYTVAGDNAEMDCTEGSPTAGCYTKSPLLFVGCAAVVCPTITLSPATLPNATRGTPYSQTITASGGASPYTFAVSAGSLPSGLTLSSGGVLSGTPTTGGTFSFTVTAKDQNGCTGSQGYTITVTVPCPTSAPTTTSPANGATNVPTSGTLTWNDVGAQAYSVFLGAVGTGCSTLISMRSGNSLPYGGLQPSTTYEWRIETATPGCPTKSTKCLQFTTGCPTLPPVLISPLSGTLTTATTFSWTAVPGATQYHLFVTVGSTTKEIGTTSDTSLTVTPPDGSVTWFVVATFTNGCPPLQSAIAIVTVCTGSEPPIPNVVAEATTGQTYTLSWNAVSGASRYEVDASIAWRSPPEAEDDIFRGANTQSVTSTSVNFVNTADTATAYFYRVRAFSSCSQRLSPNSPKLRTVVIPVPPLGVFNPNVAIPVGSKVPVTQKVFVKGSPGPPVPFTASVDKSWMQVSPQTGSVPPEGAVLNVTTDPTNLPNGTISGTVNVSLGSAAKIAARDVTTISIPVSINLVTPVTPVPRKTPPANSRIIPSVGNVEGLNSRWQSDVRIANTSSQSQLYDLIFVPGGDQVSGYVNQTTVQVNSGGTLALDDIVRNWYGIGSLNDRANGILEILPRDAAAKKVSGAVSVALTTFVSSKTYNLSASGTLPQFIPAVPFAGLIGKPIDPTKPTILGLQQITQTDQARTNLGLVEAANQPVSVLVSAFDSAGNKLLEVPFDLRADEQRQINSFLAQNKISLPDGRIEIKVTAGDGLVTGYASVIDGQSGDPLLVGATQLGQIVSDHYVLPGVADLNSAVTSWRTDARVFNSGSNAQTATLTFYQEGNSGTSKTASVTINPGEVKRLDNLLQSFFGLTNVGGVVHITTASASPLVVTSRTFNQTANGTLGQFIPAVTTSDAVGVNDRALQILQLEESARYRTNLGLAEVTGKPVRVEVSLVLPDSKVSPRTEIPLGANEFRQFGVIRDFGLPNVYNARVAVRVINGDGKVTAYGSVVDQKTQAPSFVPAQ